MTEPLFEWPKVGGAYDAIMVDEAIRLECLVKCLEVDHESGRYVVDDGHGPRQGTLTYSIKTRDIVFEFKQ